jgi:hypothetical protein
VPVKTLDVSLGRANPPDAILHQRVETRAGQRITEKQKKLAEDQRKLAEETRRRSGLLQPEDGAQHRAVYRLQAIQMQRDVCAKGTCTPSTAPARRRC